MLNGIWKFRMAGAAAALLVALSGCNWDKLEPEPLTGPAAQVSAIRMTLGTQTVTLYSDSRLTLGPLSFTRPTAVLTMVLLDQQGNVMENVSGADLQINVGSESTNVIGNFARIDAFSGTLIARNNAGNLLNPGTTNLRVMLFDVKQRRPVWGAHPVPIFTR